MTIKNNNTPDNTSLQLDSSGYLSIKNGKITIGSGDIPIGDIEYTFNHGHGSLPTYAAAFPLNQAAVGIRVITKTATQLTVQIDITKDVLSSFIFLCN